MSATLTPDAALYPDATFAEQLEAILDDLAPLFIRDPARPDAGRRLARQAVLSYQPTCDADLLSIGQIVMASKTSMALLREVAVFEMMPTERAQLIAKAQTLSRTASQVETVMERRRKRQAAAPAMVAAEAAPAREDPRKTLVEAPPPLDDDNALQRHPYIEAMRQFANVIMSSDTAISNAKGAMPAGINADALRAGEPWALLSAAQAIRDAHNAANAPAEATGPI